MLSTFGRKSFWLFVLQYSGMNTTMIKQLLRENGRALLAEFIGSVIFAGAVLLGLLSNIQGMIVAPIVLIFVVFTVGAISGAHVNPAITFGAWFAGKISWRKALGYIVAQVAAGFLVLLLASLLLKGTGITMTQFATQFTQAPMLKAAISEIIALFIFSFGVGTVMFGKLSDSVKPVVVGLSLMIGLLISMAWGGAIANPAIAFALRAFTIPHILAPLVGAVLGMGVAKFLYCGCSCNGTCFICKTGNGTSNKKTCDDSCEGCDNCK